MPQYYLPALVILSLVAPLTAGEFQFKDGDRVALVGSTLIEREQKYGYWELALTIRHPEKNITFRNLGWSGDTVWGESRVGFDLDNPQKGFQRLVDAVLAVKPTVIIVGYGTNESFAGEAGLPRFKEGLNKLLDAFAPTKARIILMSPPPLVAVSPEPEQQNKNLRLYSEAIRAAAKKRTCCFVDLNADFSFRPGALDQAIRTNGVHLSEYGYWRYAQVLELGLGLEEKKWRLDIDIAAKKIDAMGTDVEVRDWNKLRLEAGNRQLPASWPHPRKLPANVMFAVAELPQGPGGSESIDLSEPERGLRIRGLPAGKHALKIDGKEVASGSAMDWGFGMQIARGPDFDQAEILRQAIIEKNLLYFHRYRPQNETYLFGFRKQEQGNNAVEVPRFDALIEAKEKEIAKLRVPVKHTYELVPVK